MILVAGGTGTLGRHLVPLLLQQGHDVRVLTRDPARASHLPSKAEIVTGDVRAPADLAAAVRGCSTIISAVHGFAGPGSPSPESIDRDGNRALIQAAAAAGVQHFVLVSGHGAAADHPMSLHRAKFAAEEEVRASGLRFTIIRPTAFLETWITVIGGTLPDKGHALVLGPGKNPVNFVSARDVSVLVAQSVRSVPSSNEIVDIGGPENISFVTIAERLIEASGKPGRIKHIPLPVLRVMSVLARPFSPELARKARAAVVMNGTDMTFEGARRSRSTTLADLLTPG